MGDVPHPNPFHIARYSSAAAAAGEQRSHHQHQHHNNHHQLAPQEIPMPYFGHFNPWTFPLGSQYNDFRSFVFDGVGCSAVPFRRTEVDLATFAELELGASSEDKVMEPVNVDFFVDEGDDQVGFITNLFERPAEDSNLCLELGLGLGRIDEDMDDCDGANSAGLGVGIERHDFTAEVNLELGLGLGSGSENGGQLRGGASVAAEHKPSEYTSVPDLESSVLGELRAMDVDSESGSDQNLVFVNQIRPGLDEIDGRGRIGDFLCWDYLGFNQQQQNYANPYEQREEAEEAGEVEQHVYNHNWEFGGSSILVDPLPPVTDPLMFNDDEADREIEHSWDEASSNLRWELEVAVNNLNREFNEDEVEDDDDDDDAFRGVIEESMNEWRGNPPAAKSVVEALPVVNLSHEELKENEITCAICSSEISANELVTQLPCRHYYHGDCILPWLGISNTCPVCRYELPTDDAEYEQERREMVGGETPSLF